MEEIILVIPKDLMAKIDENRGDLNREDFIDLCIESHFAQIGMRRKEMGEEIERSERVRQRFQELLQEEEERIKRFQEEADKVRESMMAQAYVSRKELEAVKEKVRELEKKKGFLLFRPFRRRG